MTIKNFLGNAGKNGARFVEEASYTDFSSDGKRGVMVHTDRNEKYRAKLLLDATGVRSPTVKKYNLPRPSRSKYGKVYGGILENVPVEDENKCELVRTFCDSSPPEVWSMFPLGNERALTWLFVPVDKKPDNVDDLKKTYFKIKDEYLGWKDSRLVEEKYGIEPFVELKRHAFDNVLLVGSAGGWSPKFWGTEFSEILSNYRRVASEIGKKLESGKLDRKSLEEIDIPEKDRWNSDVQQLVTSVFCKSTSGEMARSFDLVKDAVPTGMVEEQVMTDLSRGKVRKYAFQMLKAVGPVKALKVLRHLVRRLPLRDYPSAIKLGLECAFLS